MNGSRSRLLQVVIAATLINVMPDGRAETYDHPTVRATQPDDFYDDSGYFEYGYDNWDFNDYSDPSDSGDDEPADTETDEEKKAECDAIAAKVPTGCNLTNPPLLTTNGCGGGMFANLVPDYLIVKGTPVTRLGPIFTAACNTHDRCYGTYPSDKAACDEDLRGNMIRVIYERFSPTQQFAFGNYVVAQANLYSDMLQGAARTIAQGFFDAGQAAGTCRALSAEAKAADCLE